MNLGTDYDAWQAHFQPEESGRVHGEKGVPDQHDKVSDWEERACEAAGACVEQVRQLFHQKERELSVQFEKIRESYRRHQKMMRKAHIQ